MKNIDKSLEIKDKPQCQAIVSERDTYRYTGRTKGGFEMHYRQRKCYRNATRGEYCYQHSKGVKP